MSKTEVKQKKKSLDQIVAEAWELEQQLIDGEGEVTPELAEALRISEKEFARKMVAYQRVIEKLEMQDAILDTEQKLLKDRATRIGDKRKRLEKDFKRLSDRMVYALEEFTEKGILETDLYRFRISKSQATVVHDPELVPAVAAKYEAKLTFTGEYGLETAKEQVVKNNEHILEQYGENIPDNYREEMEKKDYEIKADFSAKLIEDVITAALKKAGISGLSFSLKMEKPKVDKTRLKAEIKTVAQQLLEEHDPTDEEGPTVQELVGGYIQVNKKVVAK